MVVLIHAKSFDARVRRMKFVRMRVERVRIIEEIREMKLIQKSHIFLL